jgi:hypothetical protein
MLDYYTVHQCIGASIIECFEIESHGYPHSWQKEYPIAHMWSNRFDKMRWFWVNGFLWAPFLPVAVMVNLVSDFGPRGELC